MTLKPIAPPAVPTSLEEDDDLQECWDLVSPPTGGRRRPARLQGRVFGRLKVVALAGKDKHGTSLWRCRCECGNEKVVSRSRLKDGRVKSCGCLMREYQASKKPALTQRREEDGLYVYTQAPNGRRVNVREITCRIVRLGDDVEVIIVTPTWVAVGHYVIEPSTLDALENGEYIAQWTFLRPGGTAYRIERAFTLTEGIVSDHS